jgi:hypothetical protein
MPSPPIDIMFSIDNVGISFHRGTLMGKYDFSASLRFMYRSAIEHRDPINDSMFFHAITVIDTMQLSAQLKNDLLLELDETQNRKRGRPKENTLKRHQMAEEIVRLSDDIVAFDLRLALVDRLRTGRRHKSSTTAIEYHRQWQKHLKRMDMRICNHVADLTVLRKSG